MAGEFSLVCGAHNDTEMVAVALRGGVRLRVRATSGLGIEKAQLTAIESNSRHLYDDLESAIEQ